MTPRPCDRPGCFEPKSGKSKYCQTHKVEAREAFRRMVSEKSAERENRNAEHAALFERAHLAGMDAGGAVVPVPMIVEERQHPLGDLLGMSDSANPVVYREKVDAGVCGFAWVTVKPGNSSFALWLTKTERGRRAYQGGVSVWCREFGQSMERKEAYARAFAAVLREAGVKAYAQSRMD